jgi:hypothetical protein
MPKECSCMQKLEILEGIESYANQTAAEFLETWQDACPVLYSKAADHVIARIVHTVLLVMNHDLEDGDVPDQMHRAIGEMQGRLPSVIATIIEEANMKESRSASH